MLLKAQTRPIRQAYSTSAGNKTERAGVECDAAVGDHVSDTQKMPLPAHVESTAGSIAKMQADHHETATPSERVIERLVAFLGRPRTVWVLTAFVVGWMLINSVPHWFGIEEFDPPPFFWLGTVATLTSLYLVMLILATQRRERVLAKHHEQLTLQLTMLSEQKTAKIIQLLQEMRRDSPIWADRADPEADLMASPANPQLVIDAIRTMQGDGNEPPRAP